MINLLKKKAIIQAPFFNFFKILRLFQHLSTSTQIYIILYVFQPHPPDKKKKFFNPKFFIYSSAISTFKTKNKNKT